MKNPLFLKRFTSVSKYVLPIIILALGLLVFVPRVTNSVVFISVIPMSVPELTHQVDVIVIGTVSNQKSVSLITDSNHIYEGPITMHTILVKEFLKGNGDESITVNLLGGRKGFKKISWPDEARLHTGEQVLLFLKEDNAIDGAFWVVGQYQGKYSIIDDEAVNLLPHLTAPLSHLLELVNEHKSRN